MNTMLVDDLSADHAHPVRRLMEIGNPEHHEPAKWPDYRRTYHIGPEHVGALIDVACDLKLHGLDPDSEPGLLWAPVHAWRALGQLRAQAATDPLLALAKALDDEMIELDLPIVFDMIGPPAFPALLAVLADPATENGLTGIAMTGVTKIATRHRECRDSGIAALVEMLGTQANRGPVTCGFVVSALIDLHAAEAIEPIRDAYARHAVEISIPGDLEDVEIALGLRRHRVTPRPRYVDPGTDRLFRDGAGETDRTIQMPVRSEKIGRNEPCPCGSGKKYKKCCLP